MKIGPTYRESYELHRIVLFGAAGSCSLIFSMAFLLFLGSRISSHPSYSTDTISEMIGYAEFFLFAFSSYFAASIIVWRYTDCFSRLSVSWLPVTLVGSIAFSVSFLLRVWVSSWMTYQEGNPYQAPPPEFWKIVFSLVLVAGVCFIVTSIGCGLVSAITNSEKGNAAIPR
jgi:hypothetical protein